MVHKREWKDLRVLGIGAHPDDLDISCAGTLAKYQQLGAFVAMGIACRGDKGHFHIPPNQLAEIRGQESINSAAHLGTEVYNMGFGDGELVAEDLKTRWEFVDLIRRFNPDVIITHHPEDYHVDHVAVSKLVVDASFLSSVPYIETEHLATNKVPQVYFMDNFAGVNFTPQEYVDISDTYEVKVKMLSEHKSQLNWLLEHDNMDIIEFIQISNRFRGFQCGTKFAEGFIRYISSLRVTPERLLP